MRYIRLQAGQVHDLVLQENIMVNNGEAFQLVGADTTVPLGPVVETADSILDIARPGDIVEYDNGQRVLKIISINATEFVGADGTILKTDIQALWAAVTSTFMRRFIYGNV